MDKIIKTSLAILLFGCLFDMQYGYYQLVRFLALIGFGILAYQAVQENNKMVIIIYGALALLFQPFIKIALGKGNMEYSRCCCWTGVNHQRF